MTRPGCARVRDVLPEFALGTIDGEERSGVLDHLAGCVLCTRDAAQLSNVTDAVLAAVPEMDPPAGFEDRVLARMTPAAAANPPDPARPGVATAGIRATWVGVSTARSSERAERRRSRRVLLALAAAAVAIAVAAAGSALVVDRHNTSVTAVGSHTAQMRTPAGRLVGEVTVAGRPAAVLVGAPGWSDRGRAYRMRVSLRNGRVVDYGAIQLDEGYGGYGLEGVSVAEVQRVEILDQAGQVVCSATL